MPRLALTVVGAALTAGALACVPLGCGEAPAPVRTEGPESPRGAVPPPTDSVLQEVRAALGGSGDATVALGALESLGDAAAPAIPDVERWILARPVTTLGEPLAPEALAAFRVLERLGAREPLARAALGRLAVEPGPNRAHAALGALRALADRDPALAADLDALLRDPDGKVRAEVLAALVADRARATARMPLLLALLDDPRPAVRALAAGGLGRAGRDGVAVLGNLLDRLATGGSDTDVRRALDAIGSEAPEALADALPADPGKALDDLVAIAQGLLDRLAPPARARLWHRLTAWWLSGASSPTPDGEESLAILLAGTGAREPEVNDPLLPAFESGDAARRVRAARLLARLPGRRALLIDRLASPEAGQREAALLGLARGHPADAKAERDLVLAALRDADPAVRAAAAVRVLDSAPVEGNLVGGLTPDHRKAIVAGLTHLLGTGAPDRRRLAASALRLFPESSPDSVVALGRVLEDGDDDLRALALVALQHAQQPLAPIAPALVGVLERVRPAESPLVLGLVGRAGVAARAAAARVVALQSGTDLNVRIIAFQTLGRIDPPAEVALPALRAGIHGPEEPVQMAALACATALGMTADPLAPELLQWFSDLLAVRTAKQPANTQQTEARRQLAALLGAMGRRSASVRAAALDVVRKGAPEDRPADLAALRELGTQEAAWREAYDTLLADPDEAVREAAKAAMEPDERAKDR